MALPEAANGRWYATAAIAPALAAVFYLRSLVVNYGRLPERVPVHFGFDGQPDGWMNRGSWPAFSMVMVVGIDALVFLSYPGPWNLPTLLGWGTSGIVAGAFSEINFAAVEQRKFSIGRGLLCAVAVLGGGIAITLALAGWWRGGQ
jgi:hypothetical protein